MTEHITLKKERKGILPRRLAAVARVDLEKPGNEFRPPLQLQHRPEPGVQYPARQEAREFDCTPAGASRMAATNDARGRKARKTRTNLSPQPRGTARTDIEATADAPISEARAEELRVRHALHEAARLVFGDGLLPVNAATGKRWYGTGRLPKTGTRSSMLFRPRMPVASATFPTRRLTHRERAAALRERMHTFSTIYNAAYMLRHAQHGSDERRQQCVWDFVVALVNQLKLTQDWEAVIYAVADSVSANPSGVPWE